MKKIILLFLLLLLPVVSFSYEIHYEDYIKYSAPTWTPEGKIAFIKSVSNGREYVYGEEDKDVSGIFKLWHQTESISSDAYLCTMNIDGTDKREVMKIITKIGVKLGPQYLNWSNKNKVLISATGELDSGGRRRSGILLIHLKRKKEKMLSDTGRYASFSPSGDKIVYADKGIWQMDADGANKVQLTDNPGDTHPLWSPDGTMAAFYRGRDKMASELLVLDIEKNKIYKIGEKIGFDGWDNVDDKLWLSLESKWSNIEKKYLKKMIKVDIYGNIIQEKNDIEALRGIFSPDMKNVLGVYKDEQFFISDFNYDIKYLIKKYQILEYGKRNRKQKNNIWIKE